jgi:hypothetical protein
MFSKTNESWKLIRRAFVGLQKPQVADEEDLALTAGERVGTKYC